MEEEQEAKPTWLQGLEDAFAGRQLILDAVEEVPNNEVFHAQLLLINLCEGMVGVSLPPFPQGACCWHAEAYGHMW